MKLLLAACTALIVAAALIVPASAQRAAAPAGLGVSSLAGDPVLVGAGDIADCDTTTDSDTAALLDAIDGTVFAAGDNAYLTGSADDYANCYEPTWGRHKSRTRPAPGNHEYSVRAGCPVLRVLRRARRTIRRRLLQLRSRRVAHRVAQQQHRGECRVRAGTVAAGRSGRQPHVSARSPTGTTPVQLGLHGNDLQMRDIYQALYDFGADVVVTGHDHDYEQFHRQNADGVLDANGIREFVVGTGGTTLRPFGVIHPNSAVRDSSAQGVLKLTLHPTSYDWNFVPIAGGVFTDAGSRPCVGSAPAPIGGRGFAVGGALGGRELLWTTGTVQSGYAVARITGGTTTILPSILPGTATQHTDAAAAAGQLNCYALLPFGGAGLLGNSDLLCSVPNTHSVTGAPANAMVQLNQSSMATIAWSPPGGQTSFTLLTIPLNGSPQGAVPLPAVATRTMHETGGVPTCYAVLAMTGATVTGNSDILCAIPGHSDLAMP